MEWLLNNWEGFITVLNAIGLFLVSTRKKVN